MKVGVLLITHGTIGYSLIESMQMIYDMPLPLLLRVITAGNDVERSVLYNKIKSDCDALNQGGGVLILTDLFGATPSNVASEMTASYPIVTVSGVNLSMLLKIMNYAHLDLPELVDKAICGGHEGIHNVSLLNEDFFTG